MEPASIALTDRVELEFMCDTVQTWRRTAPMLVGFYPESDLSAIFGETDGKATFTFKKGLQLTMTVDSTSETIAIDIHQGRMIFHTKDESINVSNDFDISVDGTNYTYFYMRWVKR